MRMVDAIKVLRQNPHQSPTAGQSVMPDRSASAHHVGWPTGSEAVRARKEIRFADPLQQHHHPQWRG